MWQLTLWSAKLLRVTLSFSPQRTKSSMRELAVGQRVICKYKNGRYYQSEVLELSPTTFYEVVFDDGSYSDNLFPEDIEVDRIASNLYLLCQVKFLSFLIEYISRVHSLFIFSEPWLCPARSARQRRCCSSALDRWVDIRSQVCNLALHPYVPGKPHLIFISLALTSKRLTQSIQTTSDGMLGNIPRPQNMGGQCG